MFIWCLTLIYRTGFNSYSDDVKIFTLSGNSGYYVNLQDSSSNNAWIWQFLMATGVMTWLKFTNINPFPYGYLMVDDNHLFLMGRDSSTTSLFHMFKVSYNPTSIFYFQRI